MIAVARDQDEGRGSSAPPTPIGERLPHGFEGVLSIASFLAIDGALPHASVPGAVCTAVPAAAGCKVIRRGDDDEKALDLQPVTDV
jgi:hypothetical protein